MESGGNLVFDQDAAIYVSQTLTVRNGGRIISSNGANGYYQYDYGLEGYRAYNPTPGKTISINAANINVSSGADIRPGTGGKGYNGYYSSSGRWGPGYGAQGGSIEIYFNTINIDNSLVVSGNGGPAGDNPISYYNSGGGGSSGTVSLHGGAVNLANNARIETGQGGNGQQAYSCWIYDGGSTAAGPAGSSGGVSLNGTLLSIDGTSSIKTGLPGTPGIGRPYDSGTTYGSSPGAAGNSGSISISGFDHIDVYGLIQSGQGGNGTYGTATYYKHASSGGFAGTISIGGASTVLHVYPSGRIVGGTGGTGGTPPSTGPGANGGKGGDVSLSLAQLVLDSGSLISTGNGGIGGNGYSYSEYTNCVGGTGGAGGDLTLSVSGAITKNNEVNITTGSGGNGGDWGGRYTYSEYGSTYYFYGGTGGKGGSAVVYIPAETNSLSGHLVEIGGGGAGHNISYNHTSYGTKNYYPGTGGATGDLTVNATGSLTLGGHQVFTFAKPGCGNIWTYDPTVKSNNGSSGSCVFNVTGIFSITADNAIFFDDMAFAGYNAANSSGLTVNCTNIVLDCVRPIKWSNVSGGTLTINTDLRQFPYTHEELTTFTKDSTQTIGNHIYKFNWSNTADLFSDIPQDGFQVSQDVSFVLDETIYKRFLKLFTNVRRYVSEDGGTNWQEITSGAMSQAYVWSAPATIKGNSRLKIGITPYGFAVGVTEIWLNGTKLNTYWTPTNTNPPALASYNYAILDTDVGIPNVTLTVNENDEVTEDPVLKVCVSAVDNVTKPENLKYTISHNNGLGLAVIPYVSINNYSYDLAGFYAGGNVPSGYYKIMVKVLDETFNTGIATKTIYYMKPSEKPSSPLEALPENPSGFFLKDWAGSSSLVTTLYEGKTVYLTNKNGAELDLSTGSYPYYQVKIGENAYGPVTAKGEKRKLRLPPGEGINAISVRYCNNDKIPGEEQEFIIIVDSTPPEFEVETVSGAGAISAVQINLQVTAEDNLSGELFCSINGGAYGVLPGDGVVQAALSEVGMNNLIIVLRDEAGNTATQQLKIWRMN